MKAFIYALCLITFIGSLILKYSFFYSFEVVIYHIIVQGLLFILIYAIIIAINAFIVTDKLKFIITNIIGFIYWCLYCLVYTIILGSNFLWGNTITFDILEKYLVSINSLLNIIPIDKRLVITTSIIFLFLIFYIYYFIRIKKIYIENLKIKLSVQKAKFLFALFFLILIGFTFKDRLLDFKRTIHFKQEPLLYFTLGPMWKTHSGALMIGNNLKSQNEIDCIGSIKNKSDESKIIIIILLDALRSDHLTMYGYDRKTTPFLDSLYNSKQLIRIKNSFSTSTNTIGGVSGLFYSKDWEHFNFSQLNLMQYFKLSGYSTYAFLTGYHSGWYGLSAMYRAHCDNFYESTTAYNLANDDDFETLKKIEATNLTTGSFVFIHLLSTHVVGKKRNEFRNFLPDKLTLSSSKKEVLINNYDNGILQSDYIIKKIFHKLNKAKLLDKAIIVIVGDHGELIGEDETYGHRGGLHEKLLEVPILIYDKNLEWYKQTFFASTKDVAPTISDRIFGEIPQCWEGSSLNNNVNKIHKLNVSSATAKTHLSTGVIKYYNDTTRLLIFDKKGILQKESLKTKSDWEILYKKKDFSGLF